MIEVELTHHVPLVRCPLRSRMRCDFRSIILERKPLDFIGHVDDKVSQNAIGHLKELADFLRILGCYPAAGM